MDWTSAVTGKQTGSCRKTRQKPEKGLFHKFINGTAKIIDGIFIAVSHRIHHAVAKMILQNHLSGVVNGGTNRSQLNQHLGTVVSFFYHPFHLLQMTNGPGKPVNDGLLIFVNMTVDMGNSVGMERNMVMIWMVRIVRHGM